MNHYIPLRKKSIYRLKRLCFKFRICFQLIAQSRSFNCNLHTEYIGGQLFPCGQRCKKGGPRGTHGEHGNFAHMERNRKLYYIKKKSLFCQIVVIYLVKFFSLVTLLRSLLFAMTKLSAPLFEIMGPESWKTLVKITFSIKLTTKRAQKSGRTRKKSAIELREVRSAVYDVI